MKPKMTHATRGTHQRHTMLLPSQPRSDGFGAPDRAPARYPERYSLGNLSALQRRVKIRRHDAVRGLMCEMKDVTQTVVYVSPPLHRNAASPCG
jgi:hypothetical protein